MHTRNVSMKLKANSAPEFTRTLEKEILPLLRKQKGFKDEISFVAPERNEQWPLVSGIRRKARKLTTARSILRS